MSEWPAFSERQFELAANHELTSSTWKFFAPSTNVEQHLGFDVAIPAGNPAAWLGLLGHPVVGAPAAAPGAPGGAPPVPHRGIVAGRGIPPPPLLSATSLFVQYKLPYFLETTRAAEGPARTVFGGAAAAPFYRVTIPSGQHSTFSAWEAGVQPFGGSARYAAPRFKSWADIVTRQQAGRVLADTALMAPSALGASTIWTYDEALGTSHMRHSEPEVVEGDDLESLGRHLRESIQFEGPTAVREHLREMAAFAGEFAELTERWAIAAEVMRIRLADSEVDPEVLGTAADLAAVSNAAAHAGATWILLARTAVPNPPGVPRST